MRQVNSKTLLTISILYYIVIGVFTIFISENITDHEWEKEPLYDMIHENFSIFPEPSIPNYFVYFYLLYTIFRCR